MALPYPEGKCYFKRSALRHRYYGGYDADDDNQFYKHILVEYIWNVEADHGSRAANSPNGYSHPRSKYGIYKGSNWGTHYGNWQYLPFSYATSMSPNSPKYQYNHNLCRSGNRFKGYEKGQQSAEAWFMPMPMLYANAKTVANQGLFPPQHLSHIRAIYIPVSKHTSEEFPDLSTWVWINFTARESVKAKNEGTVWKTIPCHPTFGARVNRDETFVFNIPEIINLLSIPVEMRKPGTNVFSKELVQYQSRRFVRTTVVHGTMLDTFDFSFTEIASANWGQEVVWRENEKGSWFNSFLRNAISFGLGFVPGVGPLLSVSFLLGWAAIESAVNDNDAFKDELSLWAPPVQIPVEYISDVMQSARRTANYVDPKWIGAKQEDIMAVVEAEHRALMKAHSDLLVAASRMQPRINNYPEGSKNETDEDIGEIVAEIPPQED
ncbi:hypothetical protein BDV34DRAFT_220954 [Aspergillus parasiticus]|uniref:Uncharacterized protein n=1 Tax=Aspergillus parasiticus TaxID=5067 RepID=A0A5N6E1U8_ASPPA|nr:hypothetical protein BDV34DRAFT_220954 [Aspergillus parasiticus]